MRALACATLVIASAFAASGCANSGVMHHQTSRDEIRLHESAYNQLATIQVS